MKEESGKGLYYFKLIRSYAFVLTVSIVLMTFFIHVAVKNNTYKQMSNVSLYMISQVINNVDNLVIKKVNGSIFDMIYYNEKSNMSDNGYLIESLSNAGIDGNSMKFYELTQLLNKTVLLNDTIDSIYVYYPQTNIVVNDRRFTSLENALVSDRYDVEWLELSSKFHNSQLWLDTRIVGDKKADDSASGTNVITYVRKYPFYQDSKEKPSGILAVNIKESVLQQLLTELKSENFKDIMIINEDGRIISHADKGMLYKRFNEMLDTDRAPDIMEEKREGYFTGKIDGQNCLFTFSTSNTNGWKYIAVTPEQNIFNKYSFTLLIIILIGIVTILFGIVVSRVYARSIYNPVRNLIRFSQGILKEPGLKTNNEYKTIENTIKEMDSRMGSLKSRISENLPLVRNNFVLNTVKGNYIDIKDTEKALNILNIDFKYSCYSVSIFSIDDYYANLENMENSEFELIKIGLVEIIKEQLKQLPIVLIVGETGTNQFIGIMNYNRTEVDESLLESCLQGIQQRFSREFSLTVSAGVGQTCISFSDIKSSYNEAFEALQYRFVYGNGNIVRYSHTREIISDRHIQWHDDYDRLARLINSGERLKAENHIDSIVERIKEGIYRIDHVQYNLKQLAVGIITLSGGKHSESEGTVREANKYFERIGTVDEYAYWLKTIVNTTIDMNEKRKDLEKHSFIWDICKYIDDNILMNLNINILAERSYMSVSNLNKIFKSEVGVSVNEYIITKRMEKARTMLDDGKKVSDVAEILSYCNSQYLIRQFKETYGMTPKQYQFSIGKPVVVDKLGS